MRAIAAIFSRAFWKALRQRFAERRASRYRPVVDLPSLVWFLQSRAAHVAQTSLYGYLRTRAGTRFPELFADDAFVASINIAKWHVWLACLADVTVYAGLVARRRAPAGAREVGPLMQRALDSILAETGVPVDAGPEFEAHAARVRNRIALCDWAAPLEEEAAFEQSPAALVQWAPVVEELKILDEEIVRNSVRFRWNEVRRDFERVLDAEALLGAAREGQASRGAVTERGPA